jgi:threonine synthase
MGDTNIKLECRSCKKYLSVSEEFVLSCPNTKDGSNHILYDFDGIKSEGFLPDSANLNPFSRYSKHLCSGRLAEQFGVDLDEIVNRVSKGLNKIGEPSFLVTPVQLESDLSSHLGLNVHVKNETGNVAGSHKARHLMGTLLYIEVMLKAGVLKEKPRLAIYSCGNAALGASAVAAASGYELEVFVPDSVNPLVEDKLHHYGAKVNKVKRMAGELGDPCYNRFQEALQKGAVAFSCSGPDNWANLVGEQLFESSPGRMNILGF